ncbi:MAG: hypothetical protein L6W00_04190 [Lentisphaeria bacterium]|nr:MAG: hypothetical protein L6W00_04190 [Lentisphaeria bacterium]
MRPLNNLAANLFCCSGNMPATQTFGYAHSFEQVFYDGKLHLYDLSAQKFFPSTDRESAASLRELETELLPFGLVTPPHSADHFIRLFQRTFAEHVPSLLGRSAFTLRPGERFRIWFCNDGGYNDLQSDNAKRKQTAVTDMTGETHAASPVWQVDRIFPHYSNAYLHFDGKPQRKNPAFFPLERQRILLPGRSALPDHLRAIPGGAERSTGSDGALHRPRPHLAPGKERRSRQCDARLCNPCPL